jgi:hypothetical protein
LAGFFLPPRTRARAVGRASRSLRSSSPSVLLRLAPTSSVSSHSPSKFHTAFGAFFYT